MGPDVPAGAAPQEEHRLPGCHWHPERETGIGCTRCGRPVCPECRVSASVGFQCTECVREGHQGVRTARTRYGGALAADRAQVTKVLIGLNLLVFLVTLFVRPGPAEALELWSASYPYVPDGLAAGPQEWYRLVTAMFVHASEMPVGVVHIGFNMTALWMLGPQLEDVLGRLRFLALYLVSGVAAGTCSYLLGGAVVRSVGASGAIFGLLGAMVVLHRLNRQEMRPVVTLVVVNLVITFAMARPGVGGFVIDWKAHLGGLVAGAVLAAGLMYAPRAHRNLVQALTVAGVFAVSLLLVAVHTAQLTG
ncbi:rhomboid family intramembrane serine protease [Kitasatospora sp. NPDC096147]|uniref:rhomboid family intramembrane serine protease n=1 Tax=Kitasatospora sp. NPDC096147 TaxID=3364093 RepID=UPI0037F3FB57